MHLHTVGLVLTLSFGLLTGCSRPPDLVGIDNPETPAETVEGVSRHRLFIITTREASEVVGAFFSGERAPELGLASVDVTVPRTTSSDNLSGHSACRPIRAQNSPS